MLPRGASKCHVFYVVFSELSAVLRINKSRKIVLMLTTEIQSYTFRELTSRMTQRFFFFTY